MDDRRPVALVTGSRRGLGAAIAVELGLSGFDVILSGTRADEIADQATEAVRRTGARALFVSTDLSDLSAIDEFADQAHQAFGGIDCLVNNAAVQVEARGDMLDASAESLARVMAVNVHAPFLLSQSVATHMLDYPHEERANRRSIVFISSNNAELASTYFAEYCISKAALSMMAKLFAVRLARSGINVFDVRPGITRSDMSQSSSERYEPVIRDGSAVPMREWGDPRDVGRAVASLAAGRIPFSTGEVVHVDGGMHIPRFTVPGSEQMERHP